MATLELTATRITVDKYQIGSMQRTRGMGRPHQGDPSSTELNSEQSHPPRPTRNNSKLKVLVRSHAMREETSPPRVPTPINVTAPPPCITVNTSATSSLEEEQEAAVFYDSRTSSPSSSIMSQKPCLIVSTTDDLSISSSSTIDNNSSFNRSNNNNNNHSNNKNKSKQQTVTVRTQDVLNSTISRKFNGDFQENKKNSDLYLNNKKCENVMTSTTTITTTATTANTNNCDLTTNNNNSSPKETSSSSAINSQRNVENTQQQPQTQPQPNLSNNCECIKQNCTKCLKNNELNINNNSNNINNNNNVTHTSTITTNTLTVNRVNPRHKLRHQSSSQGSFEGSSSNSPCLSRDSSTEFYTDTHGTDLTQFLIETLNKNAKDRVFMLKVEMDLVNLAKDSSQKQFKFPAMSSYQRMLVHRCAAYFGMDHNIEPSGKAVVVSKNRNTRIPETRFKDHIREDLLFPEEPRRSILKRDSNSFEDCNYKSPDRQFDNRRSKSFEEREEEYERARRRIFKDGTMQDCNSQEEFNWAEMPWPENECTKIRLLHPEQSIKQNRLLKVQSVEGRSETLRPCVAKSYSFGGYGGSVSVLSRGDSISSTHSAGPRLLTKQDSSTSTISWRLSPSSSGYKTQSQRSDSVTPSPTATPHQLSDASGKNSLEGIDPIEHSITEETIEQTDAPSGANAETNQLVWAVTDMQSVPKGSVLIDPQTGQPFTNQDGSIYHFDPSNPPPGFSPTKVATPPKITTPQRSPIKERSPSPKKQSKSKVSPLKSKCSSLINSATSPSLPMTPPLLNPQFTGYAVPRTPVDTTTMPAYPMYPNGYVPAAEGSVPLYQPPMGMMYASYPTYENRQDAPQLSELSGYFVNMAVSDTQQIYQAQPATGGYWTHQPQPQPIAYYQPQTHAPPQPQPPPLPPQQQQQQQRYPIQIAQTPPATYYPVSYPQIQANTELVPVYSQMVYSPQPQNPPPNPLYIQNTNPPSIVYAQNTMFPPPAAPAPPPPPPPPQMQQVAQPPTPVYSTNIQTTPPIQCFNQREHKEQNKPRNNNKQQCFVQKAYCHAPPHTSTYSHSSGGSNSPANTVITGYMPPNSNTPISYRQCTPPETPPFGYPPQHSIIFRQMGGIRASPPVNVRSSRSPTPGPEYPNIGQMDRNQRYSVPTAMYHGMPAIIPGDMRLMSGRTQPPVYRQTYRQQTVPPSHHENTSGQGRPHKMRKPRTKVPTLPPSGRQSNQSIQQRY